jgi:hypothetical protein
MSRMTFVDLGGDTVGITEGAKITAVDPKNHTVTLQAAGGNKQTYKASSRCNFKKVKVGDTVVVNAVGAVATSLRGPKSGPAGEMRTKVTGADIRHVGEMETARVAAKIKSIDTRKPSVKLEGPEGGTLVVKAKSANDLEGLKVGDDLDVTYTHAVVVDLVPPATEYATE